MTRPIQATMAAVLGLGLAGSAAADTVRMTNGLTYSNVNVRDVADGALSFTIRRREISRPIAEVARIELAGDGEVAAAEKLLAAEGKAEQAAEAYRAIRRGAEGWRKRLATYRLIQIEPKLGRVDKAYELWLGALDADNPSKAMLALRPMQLGPKGGKANARAIKRLEAELKRARSDAYLKALREGLLDLYERQGRLEDARKMAALLGGEGPRTRPEGDGDGETPVSPPPVNGQTAVLLRQARLALKADEHAAAAGYIQPRLKQFSSGELPTALHLLGKAQLGMASTEQDAERARRLRLRAGLNLMRVYAGFPDSEEAVESLLLAGRACEQLGNESAAKAVYDDILKRFADTPAAESAREARKRIEEKG
jgi:TolA-binding protein